VRDAWDEFFAEAQRAAGGVRRALAGADVQHFAVGESLLSLEGEPRGGATGVP
jgi:hypothetical protein